MKILFFISLIFIITTACFAITVSEKQNQSNVEITVTFTKYEFDLFILDKADPKEWIKNACKVNIDNHVDGIKKELVNSFILPNNTNEKDEVAKRKTKRNNKLRKENSGIIYEWK